MVAQSTMWAVQFRSYGGPEVLEIGAAAVPEPGPKEVVVEVAAFSVNAVDLQTRRGKMRLFDGMGFPKGSGVDFAGVVRAVGSRVGEVEVGRRVWGYLGMKPPGRAAAGAQYVRVRADRVAPAPDAVPLTEAAALPLAGLTAVQALRPLKLRRGDRVLVVGGNGGVGSTVIQVARIMGGEVDAVVGVRSDAAIGAGARQVFDYHDLKPSDIPGRYDVVVDTAGTDASAYRRLLKSGGRMTAIAPGAFWDILRSMVSPGSVIRMVSGKPSAKDLTWLAAQVNAGELKPLIAATYPLDRIVEAHRDAESASAAGKRVVLAR
ncbi:NADP-dependent oxidoreductase [Actinomyces sp. ZJ308]|uniref:NADP-dependent oxidoreductase n=1 Tax=Actinomyces sp. ZJ308 TaxID=2708342 RepID=UPI0014220622|nr:NADP-dependent oxidoreductase [Actinomyces sp. ZJ308]